MKNISVRLFYIVIIISFNTYSAKPIDCSGDGKWEFGSKKPGKLTDESAPFIFGTPSGKCDFKFGEKQSLVNDILTAAHGTGDKAIAVITMGAPGCGKSSSLAKVLQDIGYQKEDFINIDVDDIKSKMKDFKRFTEIPSNICPGKLRAYTGVTSWCSKPGGEIREIVLNKALQEKKSFIMDGICRFEGFCKRVMEDAHKAGFTVYVVAVWAEGKTCASRALGRAFINGRWAGPNLVLQNHENLKTSGTFKRLADLALEFGGDAWIFNNEGKTPIQAYQRTSQCERTIARQACEYYSVSNKLEE